jgi:uncharacterized protein YcbX
MQSVGVIHQLARYPVKSMKGESLPSLPLTLQGFQEDRRYAEHESADSPRQRAESSRHLSRPVFAAILPLF